MVYSILFFLIYLLKIIQIYFKGLNGCGKPASSYLYFYSFTILVTMIFLNLFVAVLLSATQEIRKIEEMSISRYQLGKIKILWKEFDPNGSGYIDYKQFWRFISEAMIRLGVNSNFLLDIKNKKKIMKALCLSVYENKSSRIFCYKFHDVIIILAKIAVMIKYKVKK